jgi:cytochrome P450
LPDIEGLKDPIQFLFPSFSKLPASWFAYRRKAVEGSRQFKQLLTAIVETRKQDIIESLENGHAQELPDKDLLTMLINANLDQDKSSTYLTDSELISNLGIFYAAGHEVSICNGLLVKNMLKFRF